MATQIGARNSGEFGVARFVGNLDAVRALGYAEQFTRFWEYYLCYCEAGFRDRNIGLVQMVLAKPEYR